MFKKIIAISLLSCSLLQAAATCNNMINQTANENTTFIKLDYCSNNEYIITLSTIEKYRSDYTGTFTEKEFDDLIAACKKNLEWYDKAKENKINITKDIQISESSTVTLFSDNFGTKIIVAITGKEKFGGESAFLMVKKEELSNFIVTLEKVKSESRKKMNELNDMFK